MTNLQTQFNVIFVKAEDWVIVENQALYWASRKSSITSICAGRNETGVADKTADLQITHSDVISAQEQLFCTS